MAKGDLGRIRNKVGCLMLEKAELMFGSVSEEREPWGNSRELVHHQCKLDEEWMVQWVDLQLR